jgi:diguanylate cyclase (GGDEF)-like protein
VFKYIAPDRVFVCGEWGRMARAEARLTEMCIALGGVADRVRSGVSARHDERGGPLSMPPFVERVGAPIMVEDEPWGAVIVGTSKPLAMPADTEERLERFAGLVALAVANSQSRARLTAQTRTDPLTGLLNHRAFHERLQEEIARARRHDRALSVAVFDVDHFKSVNDSLGHAAGDSVLVEAAHRLCHVSRRDESVGRLGGDELAVIMPEVEGPAAEAAADRMGRRSPASTPASARSPRRPAPATSPYGGDVHGLMRCADRALYRAKARGRDAVFLYTAETGEELDAEDRAERLARSQALSGVRALARAIDAKDPTTTLHSERVADLVRRLAQTAGWAPDRVALLHEAALVHDVARSAFRTRSCSSAAAWTRSRPTRCAATRSSARRSPTRCSEASRWPESGPTTSATTAVGTRTD